ncbi:colicin transporter [Bifidobacterium longum]|uniref:colicin transporter n=1 Tax=Bifidobacterium longum TaxID=216816 RepID=UPI001EDA3549|nr:colicin transporter [Bifidobacterium longum]MCG4606875.1 colicin transporter [Bifidobacterium longum]MCG4620872.1 colicin transporter [Bifidobacterium longum]MCG4648344.1 colicin transporter [Bifidobacterium longum]
MNPENEIDKTEALEPVETAAANVAEARGGVDGRKRPKWLLPLIAVVCAVVLVVAGVVGWNMYRGAKLAEAKEACATAADGVRNNANEYNALLNGDAADAAAIKAEQVKDSKTVESLGKELKASAPEYEDCVAEDAQGLDAATVKLGEQADWYKAHEKSLSKAVKAVTESKDSKRLDDAKANLKAKLDEASKLLTDSDGKVQDNATRETLTSAIDAANKLKDANDATKIDKAHKTLEDAINGVNASVQAKTDADAQAAAAAAAAAAAQAQAQSTYSGGSSYSGNTYRRTGTGGSNAYRGTTSGGSGSNSGSGSTGGSASTTRPNLNGGHGIGTCVDGCASLPPIQH